MQKLASSWIQTQKDSNFHLLLTVAAISSVSRAASLCVSVFHAAHTGDLDQG